MTAAQAVMRTLSSAATEVVRYLAVAGISAERELADIGGVRDAIAELQAVGVVAQLVLGNERCLELVGALPGLVRSELELYEEDLLRAVRRTVAANRERLRVLDHGLTAAMDDDDWDTAARIYDRWWPELRAGSHADVVLRATADPRVGAPPSAPVPQPREALSGDEAMRVLRRTARAFIVARRSGQVREAMRIVESVMAWATTSFDVRYGGTRSFAAYWLLQAGLTYESGGDWGRARHAYLLGWRYQDEDSLGFCGRDIASRLAVLGALAQDRHDTRKWLDRGRATPMRSNSYAAGTESRLAMCELVLAVDVLDLERATEIHGRIEAPTERFEFFHHLLWAHVHYLGTYGRAVEALELIQDTVAVWREMIEGDGIHASIVATIRANVLLGVGQHANADRVLRATPGTTAELLLARARVLALRGDWAGALGLAGMLPLSSPRRLRLPQWLLEAVCLLRLGRLEEAAARFAHVTREVDGELRVLSSVPSEDVEALVALVPSAEPLLTQWQAHGLTGLYRFPAPGAGLTERESVVLDRLVRGQTLKQIAAEEVVSVNTVKTQVRSLYAKFGVRSRQDLVVEAQRWGFVAESAPGAVGDGSGPSVG